VRPLHDRHGERRSGVDESWSVMFFPVIPAEAGIQSRTAMLVTLDARFRGHDGGA
jgi:hypothetical protein